MSPGLTAGLIRWGAWLAAVASLAFVVPVGFLAIAPVGCESCHSAEDPDILPESSAHSAVDCVACHVGTSPQERVTFAYYQSFGMLVPMTSTRDTAISRVPDAACLTCHRLDDVTQSNGLRIRHVTCGEASDCADCHSVTAHLDGIRWPTTYSMEGCLECHAVREVTADCDSCHIGALERTMPTSSTFPFTHGPQWARTHGMGAVSTCRACHRVDFCAKCHGAGVPHSPRFVSVHGPIAASEDAECLSCHSVAFCDGCHVHPMPHPQQFAEEHPGLVATDGDETCRGCHDESDCTDCHELHVHPGGSGPLSPRKGDARL